MSAHKPRTPGSSLVQGTLRLLLWPVRLAVLWAPPGRWRNLLLNRLLVPGLSAAGDRYNARLPGGGQIELSYREATGMPGTVGRLFERPELEHLQLQVDRETTAIDVGANVGLFTVGLAVHSWGRAAVMAFEPHPENYERLCRNLDVNAVPSTWVMRAAAGQYSGRATLMATHDAAYSSTAQLATGSPAAGQFDVPVVRVDDIWAAAGRPAVSVIKVDVEGAELDVLRGLGAVLAAYHPVLMVEANTEPQRLAVAALLRGFDYGPYKVAGARSWNTFWHSPFRRARGTPV